MKLLFLFLNISIRERVKLSELIWECHSTVEHAVLTQNTNNYTFTFYCTKIFLLLRQQLKILLLLLMKFEIKNIDI